MGWLDNPALIWAALYVALVPLALVVRASPAAVAGLVCYAIAFAASHAWQWWPNPWVGAATLEDKANRLGFWYDVHGVAKHGYLVLYLACLFWFRLDFTARLVWGTLLLSELFALFMENWRCNLLHHQPLWTKIAGWGEREPDTCVALFGPLAIALPAALYWIFLAGVLARLAWRSSPPSPPSGSSRSPS